MRVNIVFGYLFICLVGSEDLVLLIPLHKKINSDMSYVAQQQQQLSIEVLTEPID